MKSFVSFFTFFYIIFFSAQPSVTSSEMLSATLSQVTAKTVDMTNLNVSPGPSGANVTWDFIAYTSNNSGTTINTACPESNYCGQFPIANRIANQQDNNSYFNINSNDVQALGSYNSVSGSKVIYSDTKKGYQFPITYGQTFTDSYSHYLQGNPDITTGTVTSVVDGYGTLFTAYGTMSQILRIKRLDNYVVPNFQPGISLNVSEEVYEWINDYGQTFLIYRIATGTAPIIGLNYSLKSLVYTTHFANLSTNESLQKNQISIFPNPAQDELRVNSKEAIKEIQIIKPEGILIKKINQNFEKIDVKNLAKGMYILKISTENSTYSEKFLKN